MIRQQLTEYAEGFLALSAIQSKGVAGKYIMMIERAVLHAGVELRGNPLPPNYSRGIPKNCFQNSARLANKRRSLYYYEGFVIRQDIGFPIHHGWCVNKAGQVIDVTLDQPQDCEYIGVQFTFDDIKRWRSPNSTSLFDTMRGININLCEYLLNQPKKGS